MTMQEYWIGPDIDKEFTIEHRVKADTSVLELKSDPGAVPDWMIGLEFEDAVLPEVRLELMKAIEAIDRYLDVDGLGPTPETLRHSQELP